MSTLTISIIALVVFVVGAVLLFNLWQSRAGRQAGADEDRSLGRGFGKEPASGRHAATEGVVRGGSGARRRQPETDQNAWTRQRREPTLLADDGAGLPAFAPAARAEGRMSEDGQDVSEGDEDRPHYMSARDSVGSDDSSHDGNSRLGGHGNYGARAADTARAANVARSARAPVPHAPSAAFESDALEEPLPDLDEDLGPPQFAAPRLDPIAPDAIDDFEPPVPEQPRFETPRLDPAQLAGAPAAGGFENTRPFGPYPAPHPAPHTAPPAGPHSGEGGAGGGRRHESAEPAQAHAASADDGADGESEQVVQAAAPPVYLPAEVDHVVTLIPRTPVNAERLIALTSPLRHVGSKALRVEIDGGQGRWVPLQSGSMVGCLRCAVLLANRQGPLNAVELSDFFGAMESLAGQIGARFSAPDMNQVLRQARELDSIAAKLDTQVDLCVEASAPITPQKLAQVAHKLDLAERGGGRFVCFADNGDLLYTLMAGETADLLTFVLDVPRTGEEHDPWRSMVACASSCAQLVSGRVVDSAGRGMSVGMIDNVGLQIHRRYQELAGAGLKAGSPAAMRVFN